MAVQFKTGLVRFSFPAVFVPKAVPGGDVEKFSLAIMIPKSEKKMIKDIEKAINEAWQQGVEKYSLPAKMPALKNPFKDGDDIASENPELYGAYEDHMILNAYSDAESKPPVLDKFGEEITNPDKFYGGCWGRALLSFYPFGKGKKGVAVGLNGVQKLKEGDRFDGRQSAKDVFNDGIADQYIDDDDELETKSKRSTKKASDDYDDL